MSETVYLRRDRNEIPFGFKLQGGSDFSIPLSVLQVIFDNYLYLT